MTDPSVATAAHIAQHPHARVSVRPAAHGPILAPCMALRIQRGAPFVNVSTSCQVEGMYLTDLALGRVGRTALQVPVICSSIPGSQQLQFEAESKQANSEVAP